VNKSEKSAKNFRTGIVTGFIEELFGHTGLTIVYDYGSQNESYLKFTVRNADIVALVKKVSQYLSKNDSNILEQLESKNDLIAVALKDIESIHSSQNPLTQVLQSEVHNFITSRLENPLPPDFLERKQFFRLAREAETPKYTLKIAVETSGPRIFASIRAAEGVRERSVWIEDDITNLQNFETNLLKGSRQALASLEGIFDYAIVVGPALRANKNHVDTLFSAVVRQNRGALAFTGRVRAGKASGSDVIAKPQTLVILGGAAGYQAVDFRWVSFDAGLALDAGIAQFEASANTEKISSEESEASSTTSDQVEPAIVASAGPFSQVVVSLSSGLSFAARLGLELPYEISTDKKATQSRTSLPLHFDSFIGIGYSF
jgi:hypothetical protein